MANGKENLMIVLRSDKLHFSFPEIHPQANLDVTLQRTLRIPDDGRDYPLPPGFGCFPLRHIDDFAGRVQQEWVDHGGVMLPMYQSEAMWLSFGSSLLMTQSAPWPFAVKIATGKRSAVTGEAWSSGLSRAAQNYIVAPKQPWLDGYFVEKGLIRQFVAMPLGKGYSAEEQLTGEAAVGGLQIEVFPMKKDAFFKRWPEKTTIRLYQSAAPSSSALPKADMGLSPGGKMRQVVYKDPFEFEEWDLEHSSRCFVHIMNSKAWRGITGENPPTKPPTAKTYSDFGLPWFEYYDGEAKSMDNPSPLLGLKSPASIEKGNGDSKIDEGNSIAKFNTVFLECKTDKHKVREGDF